MNTRERTGVVDLFCGVGGLTHGLEAAGLKVVAGIDNDPECRYGYEHNNNATFIRSDISDVTPALLKELLSGFQVRGLVGCAPCQPYSALNQRHIGNDKASPLNAFGDLIEESVPDVVSMENVRGLADERRHPEFREFVSRLEKQNYSVDWDIVDASDFGVPQKRHRLVLVASRLGPIKVPKPCQTIKKSVRNVIGDLPRIEAGETHPGDRYHRAVNMNELNLARIAATPHDGGNSLDWPTNLVPECYHRESGKSYQRTVYGRMRWDEPAPTITTKCVGFGNGRFGHPEQNRAISLREAALLQDFPTSYEFMDPAKPLAMTTATRLIGNAVPVGLGKAIGTTILEHLESYRT